VTLWCAFSKHSTQIVKDVIASYETLINLLERTQFFLQRLNHYVTASLTPEMTELLAKILAQVLFVLAISTKEMRERRISALIYSKYSFLADRSAEKFMKRLIGKTEVEDGFQQLDLLTKEENLMTAACTLGVASDIRHDAKTIKADTRDIKDDARDIKDDTRDIKDDTQDIKDDTRDIKDDTRSIKEDTRDIIDHTCDIKEDTRDIKEDTRNISDNLEVNKRGAPHLFKLLPLVPIFLYHIMI
jgi:methyl-accepting chemotaxis protein